MFARSKRLTLRPGWPEDAPALTTAIAHRVVVDNLARAPWPYTQTDAEAYLAVRRGPTDFAMLIFAHEAPAPRLVGAIGIHPTDHGHDLGYWLTPTAWGRGYATEAGTAMLGIARHALGLMRLSAGHFLDNAASGRVLERLGFVPTGEVVPMACAARGREVPCARHMLVLTPMPAMR